MRGARSPRGSRSTTRSGRTARLAIRRPQRSRGSSLLALAPSRYAGLRQSKESPNRVSMSYDSPCGFRGQVTYESIIAPFWRRCYIPAMASQGNTKMVAIVDDDDLMRSALQGLLKAVGLPAQAFASAEEFLKSGQQNEVGCLVADIRMPGMSGLELQAKLNADQCRIPTIFITAHGDEKMRMQALRAGAVEFMAKPFDDEALLESVRAALER